MLPMTKCGHPTCSLSIVTITVRSCPTYPLKAATIDVGVLCVHCVLPVCGFEGSRVAPQYFTMCVDISLYLDIRQAPQWRFLGDKLAGTAVSFMLGNLLSCM